MREKERDGRTLAYATIGEYPVIFNFIILNTDNSVRKWKEMPVLAVK